MATLAFALAIIYSVPNLALIFAVATVVVSKYVSILACIVFAWNIAKIVESGYRRFLDGNKSRQHKFMDTQEQKEWVEGEGYSYYIKDDEITFQFRNIKDHDARQLSRLIFMREKFFKDK